MIWASRIIALLSGILFGYWCNLGGTHVDWWLWGKFMIAATLGGLAADLRREAKVANTTKASL